MYGLGDLQIPHDPNAIHQLHWEPGSHGKGLMTENGMLHHWNVWRQDGDPTHRRYMMESPSFGYDPYGPDFRKNEAHFWIDPDGKLYIAHNDVDKDQVQRILELDPRLSLSDDDLWKFAGLHEQMRSLPDFDTQKQMWRDDPINAERTLSWDPYIGQGDTHTHPDVEWVPTHALKPFLEYDRRPGNPYGTNQQRWEALRDHIAQHGFNNPIVLEYNPDTNTAHMGEGNHRTGIALELGMPALPVRVNRSRRTSETQIPVTLNPQPQWMDYRGEMWVPSSLKPSHIGLETIPPPGQDWQL